MNYYLNGHGEGRERKKVTDGGGVGFGLRVVSAVDVVVGCSSCFEFICFKSFW